MNKWKLHFAVFSLFLSQVLLAEVTPKVSGLTTALVNSADDLRERVNPEDYKRIVASTIVAERVIHSLGPKYVNDRRSRPPPFDSKAALRIPPGPLSPEYAESYCYEIAALQAHLLVGQGIPPEKLRMAFIPQSLMAREGRDILTSHTLLAYETQDKERRPLVVMLDPTHSQFWRSNDIQQSNLRSSPHPRIEPWS